MRALPDGLTYGLLRYLNPDVELDGPDPAFGFNYLGRLGAGAGRAVRRAVADRSASGVDHRVGHGGGHPAGPYLELNAGTLDAGADGGPRLHATWTWASSALDHERVETLSRLWFEALAGICAHVRNGGGGSDPVGHRPGEPDPASDR